jgi:hypothetical protein
LIFLACIDAAPWHVEGWLFLLFFRNMRDRVQEAANSSSGWKNDDYTIPNAEGTDVSAKTAREKKMHPTGGDSQPKYPRIGAST